MKRLFFLICFVGLCVSTQASLVISRFSSDPTILELDAVRALLFRPSYEMDVIDKDGHSRTINQVRTVNFDDIRTAIDNIATPSTSIHVYPNPTADVVMIDHADSATEMVIYSLNGSVMLRQTIQQGTNAVDVTALPNGIYLLNVANESFKLIKE